MADHTAQAVDDGGQRDGSRGVTITVHLSARTAEVKHRTALHNTNIMKQ